MGGMTAASNVVNLAQVRADRAAARKPKWATDILTCALYTKMLRAEHDADTARIHYEARERGLESWGEAEDLRERIDGTNDDWLQYRGFIHHLAHMPATTRREAQVKRDTIGRAWLSGGDGDWYDQVRAGCVSDDHLLPPSLRLQQARA